MKDLRVVTVSMRPEVTRMAWRDRDGAGEPFGNYAGVSEQNVRLIDFTNLGSTGRTYNMLAPDWNTLKPSTDLGVLK